MREHIFRGKAKKDGKWLYGDLLQRKELADDRKSKMHRTYIRGTKYGIDQYGETYEHIFEYEVDPETVGEHIDTCDKKARSIFEGDIVKWNTALFLESVFSKPTPIIGTVIWDSTFCQFGLKEHTTNYMMSELYKNEYEVIGNIYDNPGLLEVEE